MNGLTINQEKQIRELKKQNPVPPVYVDLARVVAEYRRAQKLSSAAALRQKLIAQIDQHLKALDLL